MSSPSALNRLRKPIVNIGVALAIWTTAAGLAPAQNLSYNGGPVLVNPINVYLIYWFPPGVEAYPGAVSGLGDFDGIIYSFLGNISASAYLNIATQYTMTCGSGTCAINNVAGAVNVVAHNTDTQAYPHAGTQADPLQDSDIQNEIRRTIADNNLSVDANNAFFVITGVFQGTGQPVEECQNSGSCTFKGNPRFCGYHSSFGLNGATVHYGYLSDASFSSAGCPEGVNTPIGNHSLAADREVVLLSHELVEMITDPVGTGWFDTTTGTGNEIGDNCNANTGTPSKGVIFNGLDFVVQQQWSNATSSCVSSLPTVTSVAPSSGPNTGGTSIQVGGAIFDTTGGTQIIFGGPNGRPATGVTCPSSTQCSATAPDPGGSGVWDVIVSVGGFTSDRNPPGSNFTYTAGPDCSSTLVCPARFGFPNLLVQCPAPENFYILAGTPDQQFVGSGTSYSFNTNSISSDGAACLPSPDNSCTYFSLESSSNYCGIPPPPTCKLKPVGAVCSTDADCCSDNCASPLRGGPQRHCAVAQ